MPFQSVESTLHLGQGIYDRAVRRSKPKRPGATTGLGYYEFLFELFTLIESAEEKRLTNEGIETIIRNEFGKYKAIMKGLGPSAPGSLSLNFLRNLYNKGDLARSHDSRKPTRISLRYGIPVKGKEADAIREFKKKNRNAPIPIVPVDVRTGKHALTTAEIRLRCLEYGIRDDRFFSPRERTDSGWSALLSKFPIKKRNYKGKQKKDAAKPATPVPPVS